MQKIFKQLKQNTLIAQKEVLRKNLIRYYKRISNGKVEILASLLAEKDLKNV